MWKQVEKKRKGKSSRETDKSESTQNEKMIGFTPSEATIFVVAQKNPSLLHLVGTRHGL